MAKYDKIKRRTKSYRARRRKRAAFVKGAVFFLFILLLTFAGYFAFQAISSFADKADEPSSAAESSEPSSSQPVSSTPLFEPSSESSSEPSPEKESPQQIQGVFLACSSLTELQQRLAAVDKEQFNSVVLLLKDKNGRIYYDTENLHSKNCGVVSQTAFSIEEAAALIEQEGFMPFAGMYALQDDLASHATFDNSYLYGGQPAVSWLDGRFDAGGKTWLNPYKPKTTDYLNELTREISAAGFKGIFLYGCQYPFTLDRYGMTLGDTAGVSLQQALDLLIDSLRKTAEENKALLIPAFLGRCYQQSVDTHIYGGSANEFLFAPSAPIIGEDLSLLDSVLAEKETLVPIVSSAQAAKALKERGIEQYVIE